MEKLNNTAWIHEHVTAWGPLGQGYPAEVNQNRNTARNTKGVKEGDTPSWFYFLPNGLSHPAYPEWGGWGGRFMHQAGSHYTDAQDHHWLGSRNSAVRAKWTVACWREAYQNDFAARMRWCKLDVKEANHNPVATVDGDASKKVVMKNARPGQTLTLDASQSTDPDGDQLTFNWWIYQEMSSSPAIIEKAEKSKAEMVVPESAGSGEIHVILEVQDHGTPRLTSYRRIITKID